MTTRRSSTLLRFAVLLAMSVPSAGQWLSEPPLATARVAAGIVRHGGDIYAVGGFFAPNSLEVLYSGASSWTTLAPLPVGQAGCAAAVAGDRIYVFGSYGWLDTCQVYDIATNTWMAGPPVPIGLYWSTAQAVGTDIYLISGYAAAPNHDSQRMFILDTVTGTWSEGPSLPQGIRIPSSAVHGGFIYVFGNQAIYGNLAYQKYELASGVWSTFSGPPSGRGGAAGAASTGSLIYLVGGNTGNIYTAFDMVEVYDPSTDRWMPGPNLPHARYQLGAVYLPNENRIYAVAGRDAAAMATAHVESLPAAFADLVATAEVANHGVVTGTYLLTQAADDARQEIREVVANRRSSLEHEWRIASVPSAGARTIYLQAHRTASTDNDTFPFEVRSGNQWIPALTVTKTADDGLWQQFTLPANVSGTVRIRVIDSDNANGGTAIDSIFVDQLFLRVQ